MKTITQNIYDRARICEKYNATKKNRWEYVWLFIYVMPKGNLKFPIAHFWWSWVEIYEFYVSCLNFQGLFSSYIHIFFLTFRFHVLRNYVIPSSSLSRTVSYGIKLIKLFSCFTFWEVYTNGLYLIQMFTHQVTIIKNAGTC